MAKPKTLPSTDPAETAKTADAAPQADPLASEAGRAWLAQQLAAAEREEQLGPGGAGWTHNETKRPAIAERAAFLRALSALLPK